jgi:hypothetical protein
MGGGAALFDCDGDGDLDIYLTNGGSPNRLYRQEPGGRFVDATADTGLGDSGYGMGVAIGDVDNDGDPDVYLTNYGPDRLYENRGDGTFVDVTEDAGVRVDGWSSSAVFFDFDRDGYLDLFVARYVRYDARKRCTDSAGRPDYCKPQLFSPTPDVLLHNNGDGTFRDVSETAGIRSAVGPGLGVLAEDLDDDGWPDLYVANDGAANHLWINTHAGSFREDALLSGAAYNLEGRPEAGMGVVAADLDQDLDLDLYVTHLDGESNTLYRNRGLQRGFDDGSGAAGLATASMADTGFGTAAVDMELDGDLDLVVVNGRVTRGKPQAGATSRPPWNEFAEPNRLLLNRGDGRFEPAFAWAASPEISRGLAVGDVDSDGDLDLLVSNAHGPARLFRNEAPRVGQWLTVRAVDPGLGRLAIGARISLLAGESRMMRTVGRGGSYLSSSDPRAHFGVPEGSKPRSLEVRWPDGTSESFPVGELNQEITVVRGSGGR